MSAAATHDLYELANAYARARAAHVEKPSDYYVWMETAFYARLLKTNRISGQHVRFQDPSVEYPVPVSARELDESGRGYLEVRHSDGTVVVSYSPNTNVWCFGEKLKKQIQKLWPKYYVIEED
jgi:hypothetical protein